MMLTSATVLKQPFRSDNQSIFGVNQAVGLLSCSLCNLNLPKIISTLLWLILLNDWKTLRSVKAIIKHAHTDSSSSQHLNFSFEEDTQVLANPSELRSSPNRDLSNPTLSVEDQLPIQAARILEYIEILEELYPDTIDQSNADLKNGLRVSAVAIRAYLDDIGFERNPEYQAAV